MMMLWPPATVAINAKAEGDLVISGLKDIFIEPAPWWKTDSLNCVLKM